MLCGKFIDGNSFPVNIRSFLKFIKIRQPYMPEFNRIRIPQGISDILYNLL